MNTIVPTNVLRTDIAAGFAGPDDAGQSGSWFQNVLNDLLEDFSPTAIPAEKKPNKEQPSHSVDNVVNFIAPLAINLPGLEEPAPAAPAKPAEAGAAPTLGSINLSELDVKSIEIQIEAVPTQPGNNKEKNLSTQGKCVTADAASVSASKSEAKPQAETWQQLFTTMSEGSARPLVEFVFKDRTPPVVREIGTSDLIFPDPRVRLDPKAAMGSR